MIDGLTSSRQTRTWVRREGAGPVTMAMGRRQPARRRDRRGPSSRRRSSSSDRSRKRREDREQERREQIRGPRFAAAANKRADQRRSRKTGIAAQARQRAGRSSRVFPGAELHEGVRTAHGSPKESEDHSNGNPTSRRTPAVRPRSSLVARRMLLTSFRRSAERLLGHRRRPGALATRRSPRKLSSTRRRATLPVEVTVGVTTIKSGHDLFFFLSQKGNE